MKWVMYLSLLGSILFSLAGGVVVANWVTQRSQTAVNVVPAFQYKSETSVCPGQARGCPASGRRTSADLQV